MRQPGGTLNAMGDGAEACEGTYSAARPPLAL